MILLDTNVVSETMRPRPSMKVLDWLDAQRVTQVFVSSVTQAEMQLGVALLPSGKRRIDFARMVDELFNHDFAHRCLPFDQAAAPLYAKIVAGRQRAGLPISTEDAQIAAIAMCHGFRLATRHTADFARIGGLELINPWEAAAP